MKISYKIVLACVLFIGSSTSAQIQKMALPIADGKKTEIARLSPVPSEKDLKISLNGEWLFSENIKSGSYKKPIQVPGEWVMQGFTVNAGETAGYTKNLNIPASWQGKRIKLKFDGVSSHAIVKINGHKVAEHEGSFVPFESDITDFLHSGDNLLEVEVQALTISDILACTSQYAAHTVGGILRKVTLFALPQVNIADISVTTSFDGNYRNSTLQLKTKVINESKTISSAQITYLLTDNDGKVVLKKTIPLD